MAKEIRRLRRHLRIEKTKEISKKKEFRFPTLNSFIKAQEINNVQKLRTTQ